MRAVICKFLFTSITAICRSCFFFLLREKMPNRCVAAGCSNVPDLSKSIGLHKFPEDNDSERKRRRLSRLCGRNVRNGLPQMHQAYVHNILKPMISKVHLIQFQGPLSLVARFEEGCCSFYTQPESRT